MKATLVGYTMPKIEGNDLETVEDLIAYCARVSNPSNQLNKDTNKKLLQYLIKHKHWSPFEMANVVLEVETTRDIARQLLRHRSFTFQEFSQRYADPTKDFEFVYREARLQDYKNRQNSIEVADPDLQKRWEEKQESILKLVQRSYEWAIASGIAKEQARAILPEGLTKSRLYVNGTIRSFIHYVELRTGPETQKEHRELALAMGNELAKVFADFKDIIPK